MDIMAQVTIYFNDKDWDDFIYSMFSNLIGREIIFSYLSMCIFFIQTYQRFEFFIDPLITGDWDSISHQTVVYY